MWGVAAQPTVSSISVCFISTKIQITFNHGDVCRDCVKFMSRRFTAPRLFTPLRIRRIGLRTPFCCCRFMLEREWMKKSTTCDKNVFRSLPSWCGNVKHFKSPPPHVCICAFGDCTFGVNDCNCMHCRMHCTLKCIASAAMLHASQWMLFDGKLGKCEMRRCHTCVGAFISKQWKPMAEKREKNIWARTCLVIEAEVAHATQ